MHSSVVGLGFLLQSRCLPRSQGMEGLLCLQGWDRCRVCGEAAGKLLPWEGRLEAIQIPFHGSVFLTVPTSSSSSSCFSPRYQS